MVKLLQLRKVTYLLIFGFNLANLNAQINEHSVARQWSEQLLHCIRNDFARPPIHARNIYHFNIAMYDAWAAFDPQQETIFLGKQLGNYFCPFDGIPLPDNLQQARDEAISYACYRLIRHRFNNSPGLPVILPSINQLMLSKGYNIQFTSTDYLNGDPRALGNYIAARIIEFGHQDGSNEQNNYANTFYEPVNPDLNVAQPGNPDMIDPNRWQKVAVVGFVDQSGNEFINSPPFLCPEWGNVVGFSLHDSLKTTYERDGHQYHVYYDPGPAVYIDTNEITGLESQFKWNFMMVPMWQAHLDPDDGVMWDISPASIGNVNALPTDYDDYPSFYDFFNGGDIGQGHALNPKTGLPYEPQIVPRGDYARAVAEFWADGPDSETPPGHWIKIYNQVSDHPMFERKWKGEGPELDILEYDVKAYLTLGGALHDAAIAAWSVKGWYDYPRPVSIVRWMADRGQSSDPDLPRFHPAGVPLIPGFCELVLENDPLVGDSSQNLHKIKLHTWKGHTHIPDPDVDYAGVDWILAEEWWPYQRPSFVTPPFGGYVSGHSTYSRTAAEVMTFMTGDPYFPGGMSNFICEQNQFLVFEEGPSQTVVLQWATYQDASDQCSLSRIWGGIHPPVDDIPGRLMGIEIGNNAFRFADELFSVQRPLVETVISSNPVVNISDIGTSFNLQIHFSELMNTAISPDIQFLNQDPLEQALSISDAFWQNEQIFQIDFNVQSSMLNLHDIILNIRSAQSNLGKTMNPFSYYRPFVVDTKRPEVASIQNSVSLVNDNAVALGAFTLSVNYNEPCDMSITPSVTISSAIDLGNTFSPNVMESYWDNNQTFIFTISLQDENIEAENITYEITGAKDAFGNLQAANIISSGLLLDTRNPQISNLISNTTLLNIQSIGNNALQLNFHFDEPMNTSLQPSIGFSEPLLQNQALIFNATGSLWLSNTEYRARFNMPLSQVQYFDVDILAFAFLDQQGNALLANISQDVFSIDTQRPEAIAATSNNAFVNDQNVASGYNFQLTFNENMTTSNLPFIEIISSTPLQNSLVYNPTLSNWLNPQTFNVRLNVIDQNLEIEDLQIRVSQARDAAGNIQVINALDAPFILDTRNPLINDIAVNHPFITQNLGSIDFTLTFDEPMNQQILPEFVFTSTLNLEEVLSLNTNESVWINEYTLIARINIENLGLELASIDMSVSGASDIAGNLMAGSNYPEILSMNQNILAINDLFNQSEIEIYPNPSKSGQILFIKSPKSEGNFNLQLIDMQGRMVLNQLLYNPLQEAASINLPFLNPGIYAIRITNEKHHHQQIIVITE